MDNKPGFLDGLTIASPCSVSWDSMTGDERVRACAQCRLNVYNLSEMSRNEAETLIREKEGRLCVRFFRRADGTILTKDCPVGLRAARLKLMRMAGVAAAFVAGLVTGNGFVRRFGLPHCSEPAGLGRHLTGNISAKMGEATVDLDQKFLMGAPPPMTATAGEPSFRKPVEKSQ